MIPEAFPTGAVEEHRRDVAAASFWATSVVPCLPKKHLIHCCCERKYLHFPVYAGNRGPKYSRRGNSPQAQEGVTKDPQRIRRLQNHQDRVGLRVELQGLAARRSRRSTNQGGDHEERRRNSHSLSLPLSLSRYSTLAALFISRSRLV